MGLAPGTDPDWLRNLILGAPLEALQSYVDATSIAPFAALLPLFGSYADQAWKGAAADVIFPAQLGVLGRFSDTDALMNEISELRAQLRSANQRVQRAERSSGEKDRRIAELEDKLHTLRVDQAFGSLPYTLDSDWFSVN